MNESSPTSAGWYPDAATGETRYWDGARWTGDTRPRRRPFAAPAGANSEVWSMYALGLSVPALPLLAFTFPDESVESPFLWLLVGIVLLSCYLALGTYLLRGQGPTTSSIRQRLAEDEKAAKGRRRSANVASFADRIGRRGRTQQSPPAPSGYVMPAQTAAVGSSESMRALENLQHMLYSGALTDAEFQTAKDKLLGTYELDSPYAQIAKLAELHRDGVLGDIEFSAAKARVLGL